jgi:hypothetical protein
VLSTYSLNRLRQHVISRFDAVTLQKAWLHEAISSRKHVRAMGRAREITSSNGTELQNVVSERAIIARRTHRCCLAQCKGSAANLLKRSSVHASTWCPMYTPIKTYCLHLPNFILSEFISIEIKMVTPCPAIAPQAIIRPSAAPSADIRQ